MTLNIPLQKTDGEYRLEDVLSDDATLHINASIVEFNAKYFFAYRSDNLFASDAKNYLTIYDPKSNMTEHKTLSAETNTTSFEDVRLFVYSGRLMAVYSYLPKKPSGERIWEFGVGIAEVDVTNGILINQQSLRFLALAKNEKNYTPYVFGDKLFLIANIEPLIRIIAVTGEIGSFKFKEVCRNNSNVSWKYGIVRGGTPFLNNPSKNDSWLYSFVHSSILLPNGNFCCRYYFYTLLKFNPKTHQCILAKEPLGYSNQEDLKSQGSRWMLKSKNLSLKVVFPMGLIALDDGLLMSYGKDDCVSRLKYFHWDYISNQFK